MLCCYDCCLLFIIIILPFYHKSLCLNSRCHS